MPNAPHQTWEAPYSASRRKHSHRCRVCNRIITEGEPVLMLRVQKGTVAIHVEPCSRRQHSPNLNVDWREAFELWGTERNARLGYAEAKRVVADHPFFRVL